MHTKTFDDKLNEDGKRRAQILRRALRPDKEYIRPDPPPPGKIECFDDIFSHPSDLARSIELRRKCKAELWWANATREEKKAVADAVAEAEPYRGNEIYLKHFRGKRPSDLIRVDHVINYIIKNVLGLI